MFGPVTLDLRINAWAGQIQINIGQLPATLTVLDISANGFIGTLPSKIGNLMALTDLKIARSDQAIVRNGSCPTPLICIDRTIPTEMGLLVNLRTLWLFEHSLTGFLPSELGNLAQLTESLVYTNSMRGDVPAAFGSLQNLGELSYQFFVLKFEW